MKKHTRTQHRNENLCLESCWFGRWQLSNRTASLDEPQQKRRQINIFAAILEKKKEEENNTKGRSFSLFLACFSHIAKHPNSEDRKREETNRLRLIILWEMERHI